MRIFSTKVWNRGCMQKLQKMKILGERYSGIEDAA
jgi:hypothetical protein